MDQPTYVTQPISLKVSIAPRTLRVDKERRMLNGVIAIEPIDVKDWREFSINDTFVNDLVSAANKEKNGVKSHFGHNYSNEGKLLGRAVDWTVEDGKAKYNLNIYSAADKSPQLPGVGAYLLDLIEEDNNAMMSSIVFNASYFYQLDSNNKEVKTYYYDKNTERYVTPNPDLGKVYPKLGQLYSVDIVSEGAATNSMFSASEEPDTSENKGLSAIVHKVLNYFTKAEEQPAKLSAMTENQNTPAAPEAAESSVMKELSALRSMIVELSKRLDEPTAKEEVQPVDGIIDALKEEVAALKTQLASTPAAQEVVLNDGANGTPAIDEQELWLLNPINVKAMELAHLKNNNK